MRASSIRKALPQDEKAIREIAEAAYGIYLERMDKKPAPMLEDYAARIAAGQAYALDDGKCVQAFMVLVPQDGETNASGQYRGAAAMPEIRLRQGPDVPGRTHCQGCRQKMDNPLNQ